GHSRSLAMSLLFFPSLALRLQPVLIRQAILTASLLVKFIGPRSNLRSKIERLLGQQWGFGRVEDPIREQFHTVIHQGPSQGVAPNEPCPAPAEGRHKQPINRNQSRQGLRAEHGCP